MKDGTPEAPDSKSDLPAVLSNDLLCGCGYDLRVRGHCGTCNKYFSICLGCHLPTRANRCKCKVKTRHPDHPEEWA